MSHSQEIDVQEHRVRMRERSREEAESMMKLAGFTLERTWELANGYWPDAPTYDDVRTPWWLFQTPIGLVQIGRRKGVFVLDWSATSFRGSVTKDDVTQDDCHVHAWSTAKAVEYLSELRVRAAAARNAPEVPR